LPLVAAVGSLVLLAVIATIYFVRGRAPDAEPAPAPAPVAAAAPLPVAAPSESVKVAFTSEPSGAAVLEDGNSLGQTPITLQFSRAKPHAIELRLPGYEPHPISMDLSHLAGDSTSYSVSLSKAAPAKHVEPRRTARDDIPIFQ
jgi:serine/threonine-protein kinase